MKAAPNLTEIKLVAFDLDGTLTDGGFFYIGNGQWTQRYSVRDGVGIKALQARGIIVGFISNSLFESAIERAKMLDVKDAFFGIKDKGATWIELLKRHGLTSNQGAYMGDEEADLPILRNCGYSGTVSEAEASIRGVCDFVATKPAGNGAAREFIETILQAPR
jgi:3-deoxy-D-manno-octulosonate 8-phosphate phosphatase (KDO 8-P phosphatase)